MRLRIRKITYFNKIENPNKSQNRRLFVFKIKIIIISWRNLTTDFYLSDKALHDKPGIRGGKRTLYQRAS
jgi:hypothetical protein